MDLRAATRQGRASPWIPEGCAREHAETPRRRVAVTARPRPDPCHAVEIMNHSTDDTKPDRLCANCDEALQGPFCHRCGQSADALDRSFGALLADAVDGLLAWDGRLLYTLRRLYARPGGVAREYVEGRRVRYSPPVRLYLVVSLLFFAVMTWSGLRVVALDLEHGEATWSVTMRMWQSGEAAAPIELSAQEQARFREEAAEAGTVEPLIDLALAMMADPARLEQAATASASQAQILMVIVFALMNQLLHPRRRVIDHAVHALYVHSATLPLTAAIILASVYIPMDGVLLWGWIGAVYLVATGVLLAFDRGFYCSSWWGAALRSQAILAGYTTGVVLVTLALLALAVLV